MFSNRLSRKYSIEKRIESSDTCGEVRRTDSYDKLALHELKLWQKKMRTPPSLSNQVAKGIQTKVNSAIPDQVHEAITFAIRNMVQGVLIGSEYINRQQSDQQELGLEEKEILVREKLVFYRKAAATSGAGTGAGGILLGLADLPILLSFKIKFLFDVAVTYGFDVADFRERLYILYLFQLAFSSQEKRIQIYEEMLNWDKQYQLPTSMNEFDWRSFQQEYRDYIDLAKMLQLVPGIGAFVGAYANYRLLDKLGETAMNGYRLRLLTGQ